VNINNCQHWFRSSIASTAQAAAPVFTGLSITARQPVNSSILFSNTIICWLMVIKRLTAVSEKQQRHYPLSKYFFNLNYFSGLYFELLYINRILHQIKQTATSPQVMYVTSSPLRF
jgi:hypothetical protein